jgi:hypothetical protein
MHFLEDVYCLESFPLIGKTVCKPNIDHHQFPALITKMKNIVINNYQALSIGLVVCIIAYFFGYFSWQILLTAILAGFGNQVHIWNHEPKSSKFVEFLKDAGIIQSQKQHSKHHIPPYDKYYCVLINFNNAWLDRINFWRKLEWLLDKFGLKVKRGLPERNGY